MDLADFDYFFNSTITINNIIASSYERFWGQYFI